MLTFVIMSLVWSFVGNVIAHWLSLLTGGIIACAMLVYEKYKQKSVSWRWFQAIMALAVSISFYQAWSDEHRNSEVLKNEKATLTSQVDHLQASLEYERHESTDLRDKVYAARPNFTVALPPYPHSDSAVRKSIEMICRDLTECPSAELKKRAFELASDIEIIYTQYDKHLQEAQNQLRNGEPENSALQQSFSANLRAWSSIGMADYRSRYQGDAVAYRQEMIRRLGPGAHDPYVDLNYSAAGSVEAAGHSITFLSGIISDLRNLAGRLPNTP